MVYVKYAWNIIDKKIRRIVFQLEINKIEIIEVTEVTVINRINESIVCLGKAIIINCGHY